MVWHYNNVMFEAAQDNFVAIIFQVFDWDQEQVYRTKYMEKNLGLEITWPTKEEWEKWWKSKDAPKDYDDWCDRMEPPGVKPLYR